MEIERTTPYPWGLYPEQQPAWMAFAATWAGLRPPDTSRPFRYLDLGCGIGLTACWVKRCYPHAEVVGVDADPLHIEQSRAIAAAMGVDVTFVHGRFEDPHPLHDVDIIVLHGVWSWIGPEARGQVVRCLAERLAPGGMVYVDYNALPGRSDWLPLAQLLRALAPHAGVDHDAEALARALQTVEALDGHGFFARRPGLAAGLSDALRRNPGFAVHEFLSEAWSAHTLAEVARDLSPAGLAYGSSLHLQDAVEALRTTEAEAARLEAFPDQVLRHTVRDYLRETLFRRDLFHRGAPPLSDGERLDRLLDRHYALARAATDCALDVHGATLPATVREVVEALDGPPRTGAGVVEVLGWSPEAVVKHLGLLCAAAYVFPADHRLFSDAVDDLMAQPVDVLPVLSPSGLELTFSRIDRAIWRAWGTEDVPGRTQELLAAEGCTVARDVLEAELEAFREAVPAMVRAGWRFDD